MTPNKTQRPGSPPRPSARRFATAVLGLGLAAALGAITPAAAAAPKVDPALVGLYGTADPTYDGVFRQSLAILGLLAAGETPSDDAVQWLLDQQCAGGGFMSFNPEPTKACVAPDPSTFSGQDTNSTALAVQALVGVGALDEADAAASFLDAARNKDGGWPYIPGGDSDPNSTGVVLMALSTAGDTVDQDAVDYLAGLQVDCLGTAADQGGIASPYSSGAPDILATVQAVPGIAGLSLLDGPASTDPWVDDAPAFTCPVDSSDAATEAGWGSAWLEAQVAADAVTGGNAPWAVLSFAATRTGHDEATVLYAGIVADLGSAPALKKAAAAAASPESPGALGLAALSAAALGESADLAGFAARIAATVTTAPAAGPSPSPSPSGTGNGGGVSAGGAALPDTGGDPALPLTGLALVGFGGALVVAAHRRRTTAVGIVAASGSDPDRAAATE